MESPTSIHENVSRGFAFISESHLQDIQLKPSTDFIAGTVSGIVGLAVGFPFDTVKVRLQDPTISEGYSRSSTFDSFAKIIKEERVQGLYKGIASPLATSALLNGLIFSVYGFLLRYQTKPEREPSLIDVTLAGAGCGVAAAFVTCPTELVKIRQQALVDSRSSARQITLDIVRTNGVLGLYRGMAITILRDLGYGAYFLAYEGTCRFLRPFDNALFPKKQTAIPEASWVSMLIAGGVAGVVGWLATFGFDVVKTRIQSTDRIPDNPYNTIRSTITHSYRTEGFRAFVSGLTPTLIRAVPVNMATFAAYEFVKSFGS